MTLNHMKVLSPHGFYRMAWREWGAADNPRVLICVHGLTRNSMDFELLGEALAEGWRVVAPDMPGRGESGKLAVSADYDIPTYAAAVAALIGRLAADEVAFLGTSMGGIIGMALASQPETPVTKLVLNDVGPVIALEGLQRIGGYAGGDPTYPDLAAAEQALAPVALGFGVRTEDHLSRFTRAIMRPAEGGGFRRAADPAIMQGMANKPPTADIAFWPIYDAITCPTLLIRGADSDLLRADTAEEMRSRGPKCALFTVPDCGHAPMLYEESQISAIRDFLGK